MDRYQKAEKPKAETPIAENEIWITSQGRMRSYISYALTLLQGSRANNVIKGTKTEQIQQLIKDIREFKEKNKVDKIVVLWTANTERYSNVVVRRPIQKILKLLHGPQSEFKRGGFASIPSYDSMPESLNISEKWKTLFSPCSFHWWNNIC